MPEEPKKRPSTFEGIDRQRYDRMVTAFMDRPGQANPVSKLVGCAYRTAKKGWEKGFDTPWGRVPIRLLYEQRMQGQAHHAATVAWAASPQPQAASAFAQPAYVPPATAPLVATLTAEGLSPEQIRSVLCKLAQARVEEMSVVDMSRANAAAAEGVVNKLAEAMLASADAVAKVYLALARGEPPPEEIDVPVLMAALKDFLQLQKLAGEKTKKMLDCGKTLASELYTFAEWQRKPVDALPTQGGADGDVSDEELYLELKRNADTGRTAVERVEHRLRVIQGGAGTPDEAEPAAPEPLVELAPEPDPLAPAQADIASEEPPASELEAEAREPEAEFETDDADEPLDADPDPLGD